jgi:hypothetical protein
MIRHICGNNREHPPDVAISTGHPDALAAGLDQWFSNLAHAVVEESIPAEFSTVIVLKM